MRSKTLQDRIDKALAELPPAHLRPPHADEVVDDLEAGIRRLCDYAFSQGFWMVKNKGDVKRKRQIMRCSRYQKKNRDNRKIDEEDRRKRVTTTSANECKYNVTIAFKERFQQWMLVTTCLEHNHEMNEDPFAFPAHRRYDPDHEQAVGYAMGMRKAHTTYRRADNALTTMKLTMDRHEYNNLIRTGPQMTPQQQLQVALKDLEDAGWHVRCHEKWIVEGNERRRRVVEHFFFCSPWQIDMSRRFISEFCVVTDATFNTNHLNMPLSTLVGRSNLEEAFRAAFCYVSSESKEAFAFVFECLKELFFHDACPGPAVIVGDFALGLSAAMCKRRGITQADGGVEAMREIAELDVVGTDVQLQLCSWHAVEAIRRRLTKEAYPKEVREELHHLLWMWIQTEDVVDLPTNRAAVIDRLREKERTYFAEQYQRIERNFVLCYTKQYANLGIKSTQMGESSHKGSDTGTPLF